MPNFLAEKCKPSAPLNDIMATGQEYEIQQNSPPFVLSGGTFRLARLSFFLCLSVLSKHIDIDLSISVLTSCSFIFKNK